MKTISGLFIVSTFFSTVAAATIIGAGDLPTVIQSCVATLNCNVTPKSVFDQGGTSAFHFNEGGTDKWLMRYALFAPSGENGTPATGYLWMSANQQYAAAESYHKVTLYTDAVTPAPTNLWSGNSNPKALTLGLSTADLVAGSGFLLAGLDANNMSFSSGNLQTYGNFGTSGLVPCAAEGCRVHAQLNLTHLRYFALGSGQLVGVFNPTDSRALLYSQSSDYSGSPSYHVTQEYFVQPVPLPASVLLFASSLVGLTRFVRRRRVTDLSSYRNSDQS